MGNVASSPLTHVNINTALPIELIRQCIQVAPQIFIVSPALGVELARFYHLCMANLNDIKIKAYKDKVTQILSALRAAKLKYTTTTTTTTTVTIDIPTLPAVVETTATETATPTVVETPKPVETPAPFVADDQLVADALNKIIELNNQLAREFIIAFPTIQEQTVLAFLRRNLVHFGVKEVVVSIAATATAPVQNEQAKDIAAALDQSQIVTTKTEEPTKRLVEGLSEQFDAECKALHKVFVDFLLAELIDRPYKDLVESIQDEIEYFPTIKSAGSLMPLLNGDIAAVIRKQLL
jgi:hypothetical protein